MMKFCIVELITQTSTFRNPEFQNFHKTFKLPPPTTLIGVAGAALGFSPKKTQEHFEKRINMLGIYGISRGMATDLWKYNTFSTQKSIIERELLFLNYFIIVYGSDDLTNIKEIQNAFIRPKFALTLGNSDSLAFVKNVAIIDLEQNGLIENIDLEYCLIEGDVIKEIFQNSSNKLELSMYLTADSIIYDLPIKFDYESDYGVRSVKERKTFTFIEKPVKLNTYKKGIKYNGKFIPVFNY